MGLMEGERPREPGSLVAGRSTREGVGMVEGFDSNRWKSMEVDCTDDVQPTRTPLLKFSRGGFRPCCAQSRARHQ